MNFFFNFNFIIFILNINFFFQVLPKYFTPYESPLKPFKSFRFSPFYKENVSGGYKSLTYSNTITQKKNIVCSNDIFKGKCTNKKCPFLHFAQMTPTGIHNHNF